MLFCIAMILLAWFALWLLLSDIGHYLLISLAVGLLGLVSLFLSLGGVFIIVYLIHVLRR